MNKNKKYHYFYKITNNLNGHFYYGVHNTDNLNDGYMGSGRRLKIAYKKYGIENFSKEILRYFNSSKEAYEYESEIVNEELIHDYNCYNIQLGGKGINTHGLMTVKDKDGNCFDIPLNDSRYLSGELNGVNKGYITVKDSTNNKFYRILKNDPRYLSGELKYMLTFYNTDIQRINHVKEIYKKIKHQQGEKNSQYGTCWIHNDKESIKIKKEQLKEYISNGWIKGRKMKF